VFVAGSAEREKAGERMVLVFAGVKKKKNKDSKKRGCRDVGV